MPLLSLVIWLPIGSLFLLLLLPSSRWQAFRYVVLGTILLQGVCLSGILACGANALPDAQPAAGQVWWVEKISWMHLDLGSSGTLSIQYLIGLDGLNLGLVLLSLLVLTVGAISSWHVQERPRAYFALYLLMDTLIMGSFLALDFLLLYCFFELALLPCYFLISFWGGAGRTRAATQFLLYTLLGTVLILMVLIGLGLSVYDPVATGQHIGHLPLHNAGPSAAEIQAVQQLVQARAVPAHALVHSLHLGVMADAHNLIPGTVFSLTESMEFAGLSARLLAFLALLIGFLIKLAAFPFHTWLPEAHVEAPTPISILLAALLLKLGGYGLLRTAYSIFPEGAVYYSETLGVIGVSTILYAALNALAMQDLKRMVAYASMAHMGFVLLGLASLTYEGVYGALYHMISHGLITTTLFLVVGVLQDRVQQRQITHYQGLATPMPCYATAAIFSFFAAMGLPGLSGFVGELLVLLGAFQSPTLPIWIGVVGATGVFFNAVYFVWTIQRVFLGPFSLHHPDQEVLLKDLTTREYLLLVPLLLLILFLGLCPQVLISSMDSTIAPLVSRLHAAKSLE